MVPAYNDRHMDEADSRFSQFCVRMCLKSVLLFLVLVITRILKISLEAKLLDKKKLQVQSTTVLLKM